MTKKGKTLGRPPGRHIDWTTLSAQVGMEVRKRRQQMGLTMEQAAARSHGLAPTSAWYYFETGRRLTVINLIVISMCLRIPVGDLMPQDVRAAWEDPSDSGADAILKYLHEKKENI